MYVHVFIVFEDSEKFKLNVVIKQENGTLQT